MKGIENAELLQGLRGNRTERERMLKYLYNDMALRGALMRMLLNNKGNKTDYDHLFSQALTRFYKTCISKPSFELKTSYINYIKGIANFVWIKELKDRNKYVTEEIDFDLDIIEEAVDIKYFEKEKRTLLRGILGNLGMNCREVLMFWSQGYTMVEIAERMNYKSPGMAKKKKHNCIRELYSFLEENPEIVEALK